MFTTRWSQNQLATKLVCWLPAFVKATLDLPDDLLQRIKIRAVQDRKPLKRLVADLLSQALDAPPTPYAGGSEVHAKELTVNERGLPVFRCSPHAPAAKMTASELIKLELQATNEEDAKRAGISG